jgi:hypothetical protein
MNEVAVLWSCLPQSLLSAFELIALWRRRVKESSSRSQTQTVVNCGIKLKPERRGMAERVPRKSLSLVVAGVL